MKVAFVSLIAYDDLNRSVIQEHRDDPDFYEREILALHHDPAQKWCKAIHDQNIHIEFWYLSYLSKGVKTFRHQFGHRMLRIQAFDLRSILTRFFSMPFSLRLLKELRKNDITHVFLLNYLLNPKFLIDMADIVIWYCRRKGINVLPVYGGGSIKDYGFIKGRIKAAFLRKSNRVLCQSQAELDAMCRLHKISREKVLFFSNPLDLEHFQPIDRSAALQAISLPENLRYILYIGRLVQTKGVGHLINIMPELIRRFPKLVLLIMGTGSSEGDWRRHVELMELTDHVRFIGFVKNERLHYYYNAADALVLPSYSEGVPNVILEAIACNTPVIASAVGGIPHILSDDLGILVPPRDENALSNVIGCVLEKKFVPNQEKRRELLSEISLQTKGKELVKILAIAQVSD